MTTTDAKPRIVEANGIRMHIAEQGTGVRSRVVSGGQAASFSRALALIIAAPFSAIMIVGALVFVELTAGFTEASTTRPLPGSPLQPQKS